MMYADYAYYSGVYGGTMPEEKFTVFEKRAEAFISKITGGRAFALPVSGAVISALCAVSDELYRQAGGCGVKSESNDGMSVTYESDLRSGSRRLYDKAAFYLMDTGLLYPGV